MAIRERAPGTQLPEQKPVPDAAAIAGRVAGVVDNLQASLLVCKRSMNNYHLTPPTLLPSLTIQEAKEKRRKVLEAARQRRREIYKHFHKKMKTQSQFTA